MAVTLLPGALNFGSQGNWISVQITTEGWAASEIVVGSLLLDGVPAEPGSGVSSSDPAGGTLTVKFPRAPFAGRPDGEHLLPLTGKRSDGMNIAGTATLSVHGNGTGFGTRRRANRHDLRVVQTAGSRGAVAFSLDAPAEVTMDVVDLQGRTVARLTRAALPAGEHLRAWPEEDSGVPAGIYMIRLRAGGEEAMVRLAVFR